MKPRFLLGLLFLSAGCLGPSGTKTGGLPRPPVAPPPSEAVIEPLPGEPPAGRGGLAVLWVPNSRAHPLAAAEYLQDRPHIRVTAILPERFFDEDEDGKKARSIFQALVSSRQVEVVMTLPGRPILPLLMDTENARLSSKPVPALPARFSWPEDATGQIALARSAYRRRWKVDPSGLALPWEAALGPDLALLHRFGIRWALMASTSTPTLIDGAKIPLLRAALPPAGAARRGWYADGPGRAVSAGQSWGPVQVTALEELEDWQTWAGGADRIAWVLLSEWTPPETIARAENPAPDFTPWIGESEENRAWELLGVARQAVEEYKNSGQADVRALDLATREIYTAEGGRYFDIFGQESDARDADAKREFLATLNQVFQIMGRPVPPEIRAGFTGGNGGATAVDQEGTFEKDGDVLRWKDPTNDDRGPGDYFYPTGSVYPVGAWDLKLFEVRPDDTHVNFYFDFTSLGNAWDGPLGFSFPLVDLYIDINASAGAGSQNLLPGRPGLVEASDAWEYALTVDGWGAKLYQYGAGGAPKAVSAPGVVKRGESAFVVTVPRAALRGSPESWGYGLVVMGRAPQGGIMAVRAEPGPGNFGGAARAGAPPYIDLLAGRSTHQRRVLGVYRQGQDVTIPFVRAE